ncbi:response regulator [candidate division GN15 bacterium]|nr:response regulator [candidate division GN15 bacterium]
MRHRVHNILLVSSMYDSFILEEDGRLEEGLITEYIDLNLVHMPRMRRASSASKALQLMEHDQGFDLIIATMHLGDMHALEFVRAIRTAGHDVPVVLLTYDYKELKDLTERHGVADFTRVFLWQGDFRILLAIVKCIEDEKNVAADTASVGVQSIIVVEDSIRFYSAYLPMIYTELMYHSQNVLSEGVNLSHRILRMRARPKILLCESYEEAWDHFEKYHENILGVISDIEFPRGGMSDPKAGVVFARNVRKRHPDIPILLQSQEPSNRSLAEQLGVSFVLKNSDTLLHDVREFMVNHLSFGDFIFRDTNGVEVARAHDLRSLEQCLHAIPDEVLLYHSRRNHFSNWLKARTEFWLAHQLRPRQVSDYASVSELRQDLIRRLREFRRRQQRGTIVDFDPITFDTTKSFARIGGGSLGGKGRGLAFVSTLIETYNLANRFDGVEIDVPPSVVLGTDVFDRFIEDNRLRNVAINSTDDQEIRERFLEGDLPGPVETAIRAVLELIRYPLAVRSSSLLEDSQHQPFAGIYDTFMLPNHGATTDERLTAVLRAIKLVYASTFCRRAKTYMRATPYRLEEEKMAVVIQRLVGSLHQNRFYPDISGVARSHNFYPSSPMTGDDGIASVALGLGTQVVEGGATIRFCPRYPKHLIQFSTVEDTLTYSQKDFYALELSSSNESDAAGEEFRLARFGLRTAEEDNTLAPLASTYSRENDAIYEGISRSGVRLVSFAPILKNDLFPLPEILQMLLEVGRTSMSSAVEIEFAVNLSVQPGQPKEFAILQMRPMVVEHEWEEVQIDEFEMDRIICESSHVLGNGIVRDVRDIIFVDTRSFNRSMTKDVAEEISRFNFELSQENASYILIGVGRWGSSDPWLGIPVTWEQISGARIIVEAGFKDMQVQPSQGSHFFQNIATMEVGYFTIDGNPDSGFVDWSWLNGCEAVKTRKYSRRIRFEQPVLVKMDGHRNHGVILRPDR